ncbi:MAG: DUF1552 domain-containing protein [Acidobacteria bacterium]|nr:DUF1552 domain-containing protein [Acidobacteriota bacterium]
MRKSISRRTLLRGAGVAMSLPWMEAISSAAPASAGERLTEPPLRMAFLFMPNGVRPDYWTPPGDGDQWETTPHLKPLESLKGDFVLLENLWHKNTVGRNGHWPKVPAWLSGGYVQRSTGRDLDSGGTSLDQLAARHIGAQTPLPSIELGIDTVRSGIDNIGGGFARMYGSFVSWRDPHTPVNKEIVPQLAFDRLFRNASAPVVSGLDGAHSSVMASLQRDDTSVLDLVKDDAYRMRRKGSIADQIKLDEYFEAVRSVELRMEAALKPQKRWINEGKMPMERPGPGIPATHKEHLRLMLDILILALWTDTTRIATMMLGDAQSSQDYSWLDGVKGNWHGISHHLDEPAKREQYERIINWNVEQVSWFLNKMKSLKEGGSTLLDNSMVLYGSSLKCGNRHLEENLPILLAGRGKGTIRTGRRLRAAAKTPLCNLHLAMLQRMGVKKQSFGDSTGALELS